MERDIGLQSLRAGELLGERKNLSHDPKPRRIKA